MTRARFPAPWPTIQAGARLVGVALSIAALCSAIYITITQGNGRAMVGAYIGSIFAIMVNAPEALGLLDRQHRTRRCTPGYMGLLDLFVAALCGILPWLAMMYLHQLRPHSDDGAECDSDEDYTCDPESGYDGRSRAEVDFSAMWLLVGVAIMHFFFAMYHCVGYCRLRSQRLPYP